MATRERKLNVESRLLKSAVVGGAGISLPANIESPRGYASISLHVPEAEILNKTPMDIQEDIGLPWGDGSGGGIWFDEYYEA